MQHILLKIFNRKFRWQKARLHDDKSNQVQLIDISGYSTKKLTSDDFFHLYLIMNKMGINDIRFVAIDGKVYICIE